ncbi:MAG: MFS transporter [Alphaproteobacteria bacterium]|nr:MFS transporter [Alphaproteobacteria bacterium]MBU0793590.1 MFS transporter [Alphaproteobacteria bacterium]MBU0875589.1 MFS transporter [Alphaproteobacteria bacterium]MBU1771294.1 MFS transporter [Alphaproteobacteria bacterium]
MSSSAAAALPEQDGIDVFETAKLRPRYWFLVFLLMTQGLFEFFDFYIIGFLVSVIGPEWNLTFGEVSIVLLSAGVGQLVGALPFAWFADRYGRKPALICGIVLYSLAAGCAAFVPDGNWQLFAVLRFLVGVGYGGTQITLLIEIAPTRWRTMIASASGLIAPGGVLMASLLVSNYLPVIGWRGLALLGFFPLVIAFALYFLVPESVRWLVSQGRAEEAHNILAKYVDLPKDQIPLPRVPKEVRRARVRDIALYPGRFLLIVVTSSGLGIAGFGVALWGPTVLTMLLQIDPAQAAAYFVFVSIAGIVGRAIWTITPQFIGRWRSALICLFGTAVTISAAGLLHPYFVFGVPVFLLCLMCGSLFYDGGASNTSPYGTELFPVRLAGLGGGIVQMVSGFGKLIGPIILALIAGSGNLLSPQATEAAITPGFLTLASFAVIGFLATLMLRYETHGVRMVTDEEDFISGKVNAKPPPLR